MITFALIVDAENDFKKTALSFLTDLKSGSR